MTCYSLQGFQCWGLAHEDSPFSVLSASLKEAEVKTQAQLLAPISLG